mgnify:CR=1 FL=1
MGHGQRAAEYYQEYCAAHDLNFEQRCYDIMYYHDRDDQVGIDAISDRNIPDQNARVDFPPPLGPVITKNLFAFTCKLILERILLLPS